MKEYFITTLCEKNVERLSKSSEMSVKMRKGSLTKNPNVIPGLNKDDIDIILKHSDNVSRKNFTSVALSIQIPFDNDEISAKAMCSARPDQDRTHIPKTISFKYAKVGITFVSPTLYSNPAITSMNGKPRCVREKNAIP